MYKEIIRHLMKWEIFSMLLWTLLCLVLPSVVYTYILHKEKKKKHNKSKKKKTWKQFFCETPEGKALSWVIVGVVFFCIFFGKDLYQYLSLREDMINENYAIHTGEFYYDVSRRGPEYLQWTNEQGEIESIRHNYHINKFQTTDQTLKDGYHKGTVVYSPSSGLLLWWDAEPIED